MPAIPRAPVDVYRSRLYTADELYDAGLCAEPGCEGVRLAAAAARRRRRAARSLHDHAIDAALEAWVAATATGRRDDGRSRAAARRGGATRPPPASPSTWRAAMWSPPAAARERWRPPTWAPSSPGSPRRCSTMRSRRWPRCRRSGPRSRGARRRSTYGTGRAGPEGRWGSRPGTTGTSRPTSSPGDRKYFHNAIREAPAGGLRRGHRLPPGAGGTVQEVFQDACENYYADERGRADGAGRAQLLDRGAAGLAAAPGARPGRAMEGRVHLVDTVEEVLDVIAAGAVPDDVAVVVDQRGVHAPQDLCATPAGRAPHPRRSLRVVVEQRDVRRGRRGCRARRRNR